MARRAAHAVPDQVELAPARPSGHLSRGRDRDPARQVANLGFGRMSFQTQRRRTFKYTWHNVGER
jgi:hypothetical protein